MPEVRKWEYDGVTCNNYGFEQSQWLKNWWNFTDYRLTSFLQNKQQLESLQIFPLDTQVVNLTPSSEKWIIENWTLTNSFRAAYITWDESNTMGASSQQNQLEQEFDYDEFPLEQFYNLSLKSTHDFQTATIQHETTITVELNKNPFSITSQTINPRAFSSLDLTFSAIPSPYIAADFVSQKNYLGLSIEYEVNIGDRLYLYFEGILDIAISDTTDIGEISLVEPIENTNFYPEISLDYQLTDSLLAYASFEYSTEPIVGIDARNRPLRSEVYQGFAVGIETQLSDQWSAEVSFEREIQNNITTSDPNEPDFDLQINQQTSNSWTGEIRGEITPSWWLYGFYTYTDAIVTEDELIPVGSSVAGVARDSGGLWTSYEIPQGALQGFGFGGGFSLNGDRPSETEKSFTLPSYLQTDVALFYSQDNFKAAISVQNLFNAGIEDEEVTERSLLGTVWFKF